MIVRLSVLPSVRDRERVYLVYTWPNLAHTVLRECLRIKVMK